MVLLHLAYLQSTLFFAAVTGNLWNVLTCSYCLKLMQSSEWWLPLLGRANCRLFGCFTRYHDTSIKKRGNIGQLNLPSDARYMCSCRLHIIILDYPLSELDSAVEKPLSNAEIPSKLIEVFAKMHHQTPSLS
jgi:hypothetical protein